MYILYWILAAAGFLFALSMLFICVGLFKNPKIKEPEIDVTARAYPSGGSLFAGRIPDKAMESEDEESSVGADEETDDENSIEAAENSDPGSEEKEPDNSDDENDKSSEVKGSAADDPHDDPHSADEGISVSVTVIDTNKTYKLKVTGEALIGRNPKCDVVVPKPMVSSVHCILIKDKNKLMVEDNNSTNGTLLNGKPLKHVIELKNNDMLTLGDRQVRINL